jgi:fused signal recognition particle receptor
MVFNWFNRKFGKSAPKEEPIPTSEPLEERESTQEDEEKAESSSDSSQDYLQWAKTAYKNIQERQKVEELEGDSTTASEVEPEVTASILPAESVDVEPVSELEVEPAESIPTAESPDLEPVIELEVKPEPIESVPPAESPEPEPAIAPISELEAITESIKPLLETESQTKDNLEPISSTQIVEEAMPLGGYANAPVNEVELESSIEPVVENVETTSPEPLPFWATEDRQARLERLKETAIETKTEEVSPPEVATPLVEVPEMAFDEGFLWSAEVLAGQGRRPEDVSLEEISWLKRLRQGLEKTRRGLVNQLKSIVGQGPLNQAAVAEIEASLLQADVGIEATDKIISRLQKKLKEETLPPEAAIAYLKQILREMLESPFEKNYQRTFVPEKDTLNIWLLTGVNGVGKTTTIGKIAHLAQKSGYKCLIGAADTFRAAAVEQVKVWGQRSGIDVIANPGKNVDPAAVVFDSITAAQSRGTELLLVDTAGRLQNKKNLMEELSKIRRIVDKKAPNAQIESLLVLDSTLGQNGLRQAQVFAEAAKLSGVVITKLDGTAKGGVALAVVQELGLPIRFIGAGEGIEDLRPFNSYEFVEALLNG